MQLWAADTSSYLFPFFLPSDSVSWLWRSELHCNTLDPACLYSWLPAVVTVSETHWAACHGFQSMRPVVACFAFTFCLLVRHRLTFKNSITIGLLESSSYPCDTWQSGFLGLPAVFSDRNSKDSDCAHYVPGTVPALDILLTSVIQQLWLVGIVTTP